MVKTFLTATTIFALASINTGCSHRTVPEQEFGAAVRSVMNSQIHDYESAMHPNPDAVEGSDPERLNNALEAHREDVTRPDDVQPVSISIGRQ